MQSSVQPNSVRALQQQHLVVVCWTPGGRLVSRTGSTPSSLDSTDSGASQQGWSGTGIRADSQDWSGTYIRADSQGWLGTCIRADGQGWSGTCTRADGQQHRPSSTFSNTLRRHLAPSDVLQRTSDALRHQRFPRLPHLSFLECRHISSLNMFLQHFELTSTTAHCSVHMPKHPSEEAGPSDRCAMPSWPTPQAPTYQVQACSSRTSN